MNKPIKYTEGHVCRSNGVGDYEMVCPTHGLLPRTVPFMQRSLLSGNCPLCGKKIEADD